MRLCLRIACHTQHLGRVRQILGACIFELGVILEVVVAIRQSQAALMHDDGVLQRIPGVLIDVEIKGRGRADAIQMRNQRRNVLLVRERVDGGKFGLQRLQSQRLESRFIHEALVQIGDFLCLGAGIGA